MQKKLLPSLAAAVLGAGLLVGASFASSAGSNAPAKAGGGEAKRGGTLRVNLSTTDVQYTDPSLEYESTGWQVEYATQLKLLNWRETKATLFPEAATSFPLVSAGGRRYTFHIRPGQRLSNGEKITAANFRQPRGQVDHHVRMRIELAIDPIDILRIVAEVDAHECRLRVLSNDANERLLNLLERRILLWIAEPPTRMVA